MSLSQAQRRKQAVERYLAGDKIDDICQQMACSKSWLYKWKQRYAPDDPTWNQAHSTRPATHRAKTAVSIELAICEMRQAFEQSGLPAGAPVIQAVLRQQGVEPLPSVRTIYRILRRRKLDVSSNRQL